MSELRPIELKYSIEKEHWVGSAFRVRNYFPEGKNLLKRFSPFVLLDYNAPKVFPPSKTPKGIGPHPHKGIETVTFAFKGSIEHHDNAGNHGIIHPGDVQWMSAGSGIMHKEYHEKNFQKKGGSLQMVQLWIKLPKKDTLAAPRYQEIKKEKMGRITLADKKGRLLVVAGNYKQVKGPAKTFSPINIFIIDLEVGASFLLNQPADYNTGLLILSGNLTINSESCQENDFVLFENKKGDIVMDHITSASKLLLLSGQALNEPLLAGGPFVMNTKEELDQAFKDYREKKFGREDF
ncbi:MAG TPA: pirin family protein [Clostridia bacterium]|nr:pirin family protein [Clostridia bacterium]